MVPLLNTGQRSPLQIDAFSLRCGELAAPTNFQTEVGVLEQGMCLAQQVVLNNVNQDTFGDYLDVASSRRLQRLEAKCIDYLLANFEKVGRPFSLGATRLHPDLPHCAIVSWPEKSACQEVRASTSVICCNVPLWEACEAPGVHATSNLLLWE